jgi:hypothetical protein
MSPELDEGPAFTDRDRRRLGAAGIDIAEARRQLALLRNPPPPISLAAPCTANDGILVVDREQRERSDELWREACTAGRITKLVPASGAASRMFASLSRALAAYEEHRPVAEADRADVEAFTAGLERFAFADDLRAAVERRGFDLDDLRQSGRLGPLLEALLTPEGLGLEATPKGLISFHRSEAGPRTAVEEQLAEAEALVRDGEGVCRVHFTVPVGGDRAFRDLVERSSGDGTEWQLGLSHQEHHTDTLCLQPDGAPFRDEDGDLLLRPGGHGALLGNLASLGADLVLVKNVDNVQPAEQRGPGLDAQRLLVGLLCDLQQEVFALLEALAARSAGAEREADAFVRAHFGRKPEPALAGHDPSRERLIEQLDRPLRVCGMVQNLGEAGGGPFWAERHDGTLDRQIVESSEVAPDDPAQQAILASSTHFNPVLLALALRDRHGRGYDLTRYRDPQRAFISRRSHEGRALLALEQPGLWNGAMAGWNTVFVEVPHRAFTPVKTVLDLLRPEHG